MSRKNTNRRLNRAAGYVRVSANRQRCSTRKQMTLAKGYIKRLLENSRVLRHLREHHGDLLAEFEGIAATERGVGIV